MCSARTGAPQALLADEGWLTDARTAAAGALAARAALTPPSTSTSTTPSGSRGTAKEAKKTRMNMKLRVAVLGAGVQARMQLDAIRAALLAADDDATASAGSLPDRERREYAWDWEEVRVWARRSEAAEALAAELLLSSSRSASGRGSRYASSSALPSSSAAAGAAGSYGAVSVAASPREAVLGANLVITATPSREPLISSPDWLSPGATVLAGVSTVGSPNRRIPFPSYFPRRLFSFCGPG